MKKLLLILTGCFINNLLIGQFNNAINTSSWGGVSNVTWNPAIADGRYQVDISLGTINSGFIQKHAYMKPLSIVSHFNINEDLFRPEGNLLNDAVWRSDTVAYFDPVQNRNLNQFIQFEGPGSFMFPFGNGQNAVSLNWHLTSARTMRQFTHGLANGTPTFGVGGTQGINITQATWMDYGATYSRVFYDEGDHFFKAGLTVKLINTITSAIIQSDDFTYTSANDSIYVKGGKMNVNYSDNYKFSAGGDIGFVYEWRPKKEKYAYDIDTFTNLLPWYRDLYTLAVGFSVIDIGYINAKKKSADEISSQIDLRTQNFRISEFDIFSTGTLAQTLNRKGGTGTGESKFNKICLPTRFNMYVDYNIWKGFKLNLNASVSPYFNKKNSQITYGSYLSLVPRFDVPMFGFYLPLTYHFSQPANKQVSLGASMRAGPVWFGVSDVIGMATNKMADVVIYAGLKVPLYYRKPKDKDGDKISNRYDRCRTEIGNWVSQGCPDIDGDGIKDGEDFCPGEKGLAYLKGCPDMDGDSITDRSDECPDIAGPLQFKGCPDTDNDGLPEKEDRCPRDSGAISLKGCPDVDADGVPDIDDSCRTAKGEVGHAGCPDTDKDGIYDNEDEDIYTPGPKENHGKPWEDSDGDGLYDNEDACPLTAGKKEYKGCAKPPKPNRIKEMSETYDTLFFEIREKEVTMKMERQLKIFAEKMKRDDQKYNSIILVGHTDNSETEPFNRESLSIDRAMAVEEYLMTLGIEKKRIEHYGEGDSKPLNENLTAADRKKNRRVEIIIQIVPE